MGSAATVLSGFGSYFETASRSFGKGQLRCLQAPKILPEGRTIDDTEMVAALPLWANVEGVRLGPSPNGFREQARCRSWPGFDVRNAIAVLAVQTIRSIHLRPNSAPQ